MSEKEFIKHWESTNESGANQEIVLDYDQIDNIEVDGINHRDAPDFCDAFIASADYKGRPMTEKELDVLNEDGDFVYNAVCDHLW